MTPPPPASDSGTSSRRAERRSERLDGVRLPAPKLFVGGEWVAAASGETFSTVDPFTEETLGEAAAAGPEDVDRAVRAAREALGSGSKAPYGGPWGRLSPRRRGRLLQRLADRLEARLPELARLETLDNGKTLFESEKVDLPAAVETFRHFASLAETLGGETLPVDAPVSLAYTRREPHGVVGAIVPWNFPLVQAAWKLAPALACGNAVILKPAPQTPLTALLLAEVVAETEAEDGLPAGAVAVLTGDDATGKALVAHPGVDKISFTGSTAAGRAVMAAASGRDGEPSATDDDRPNPKRLNLELGGKSAQVVFADADLDAAVRGCASGIFYGKGEVCAAGSRVLVERSVHDRLVEGLVERAEALTLGDPLAPGTRLGPLVSADQRRRVLEWIERGRGDGATVATGGEAASVDGGGFFVRPTVLTDVDPASAVAREEIFGPVVVVIPFDAVDGGLEDVAVGLANDSPYGLAAGLWTGDAARAHRLAARLRAGTVWVNCYNVYDPAAPFGGVKASGFGRELGRAALDAYTDTKTVWIGR